MVNSRKNSPLHFFIFSFFLLFLRKSSRSSPPLSNSPHQDVLAELETAAVTRARAAEEHARALSVLRSVAAAETSKRAYLDATSSSSSPSSRISDIANAHSRSSRLQRDALEFSLSVVEGEAALAEGEVTEFFQGEERVRFFFAIFSPLNFNLFAHFFSKPKTKPPESPLRRRRRRGARIQASEILSLGSPLEDRRARKSSEESGRGEEGDARPARRRRAAVTAGEGGESRCRRPRLSRQGGEISAEDRGGAREVESGAGGARGQARESGSREEFEAATASSGGSGEKEAERGRQGGERRSKNQQRQHRGAGEAGAARVASGMHEGRLGRREASRGGGSGGGGGEEQGRRRRVRASAVKIFGNSFLSLFLFTLVAKHFEYILLFELTRLGGREAPGLFPARREAGRRRRRQQRRRARLWLCRPRPRAPRARSPARRQQRQLLRARATNPPNKAKTNSRRRRSARPLRIKGPRPAPRRDPELLQVPREHRRGPAQGGEVGARRDGGGGGAGGIAP